MPTVFGDIQSGNCYKIALLFANLEIAHDWQEILVTRGETRTRAFLAMNPAAQIPVVRLDDGTVLTQSNAILHHFARGTGLVPTQPLLFTRLLEWQFFEQYNHEPTIAVRRFIKKFLSMPSDRQAEYEKLEDRGYAALQVMEQHLSRSSYLVGDSYSIADISLYAYTHVANEGGFDLSGFTGIEKWLTRVESQPGYLAMSDYR